MCHPVNIKTIPGFRQQGNEPAERVEAEGGQEEEEAGEPGAARPPPPEGGPAAERRGGQGAGGPGRRRRRRTAPGGAAEERGQGRELGGDHVGGGVALDQLSFAAAAAVGNDNGERVHLGGDDSV